MSEDGVSLADQLDNSAFLRSRIDHLRELAYQDEAEAHRKRAEADTLELELVERRTAANILREVGLVVDRDEHGLPRVHLERLLVAPPGKESA